MKKTLLTAIALIGMAMGAFAQESNALNIKGPNGIISAVCHKPSSFIEGNKCPMVVLMHDVTSDKEDANIRQIATQLEQQGVGTIIFDFSGCGASEGEFKKTTPKSMLKDAAVIIDYAKKLPYVKGIGLCAVSYSGVLGILSASDFGKGDIKALALVSPLLSVREDLIRGTFMGKKAGRSVELSETRTLDKDFLESAQETNFWKAAKGYKGETLILMGKEDALVPYTYGEMLELMMPNAKFVQIKDVDHNLNSKDVEKHSKAINTVAEFLLKQLK